MTAAATREVVDTPWTQSLPSTWHRTYLGHLVDVRSGATPSKDDPSFWDGQIPWVSPKDMKVPRIYDSEDHVTEVAVSSSALRWIVEGSVLMVTRGMILDHTVPVALAVRPLTINQDLKALVPRGDLRGDFLAWLLVGLNHAILARVEEAAHGTKALRTEQWKKLPLAIPPEPVQYRIADFLDRKTAAIDELVRKKERLIEILQEKRQALITEAVTKGLDRAAPLKASGVESLGEIPSHWRLSRLKHLMSHIVDCPHTTPELSAEGPYPVIRTADVERGRLLLESAQRVSEEIYRERVERLEPAPGDILFSREGERFGMAALVLDGVKLCLGQRMMLFRPRRSESARFFMWVLNSAAVYRQVKQDTVGATSPRINIPTVCNAFVPVPPRDEQEAIARHIEGERSRIDECVALLAEHIERIREYRQALITAAVTGRLEVA